MRFTRWHGRLVEAHAQRVVEAAFVRPESQLVWLPGTVHRASAYPTPWGERETPDVAIDLGQDLILIEVTGGRLTQASLVDADLDAIRRDIDRLLEDKIRQLGDRIRDMHDGLVQAFNLELVERVWPIIVSPEGIFQTPSLWAHLRAEAIGALGQPKVQPLTLLDLEEFENLMGLAHQSGAPVDILRMKTAPAWQEREFTTWCKAEGPQFGEERSEFMEKLFRSSVQGVLETLFDEDQQREYQELGGVGEGG
jgi:hypothetical protein